MLPDIAIRDLDGRELRLGQIAKSRRLTVLALTSTSCPLSKKYLPTLEKLSADTTARDVGFVLINPMSSDDVAAMRAARGKFPAGTTYVHDADEALSAAIGARTTTDVVVVDASRTVVYHGAIDDQYGFGYSLDAPRRRYLADALEASLANMRPEVAATDAPGCVLASAERPLDQAHDNSVTYHNRISRIVDRHCAECHRDGGAAPFSLTTADDLAAHAPMIRQVVERGTMPPWFAAPDAKSTSSESEQELVWANDRSLSPDDEAALLEWLAGERPLGDEADAPVTRRFASDWSIGKPDAIFSFDKPVAIKATGTMPYQNILVETKLPEDKWVRAVEIRPGNREVVHHVLVFVHGADDASVAADDQQEGRDGYWAIYVPGNSSIIYPAGLAKRLPKGTVLRFQMHYTPNGAATEDKTEIGLVFAEEPPRHEVRVAGIVNARISIPPGEANHRETAQLRIPHDVEVLALLPHMHLRGKACRYDATTKAGEQNLLDIPRYDFNWQLAYRYAEPKKFARGDVLSFTAWYDNSAGNPANPDPTQTVRWGAQTYDEMHLGYVEYIVPDAKPGEALPERSAGGGGGARGAVSGEAVARALFRRCDTNDDGGVSCEELRLAAANLAKVKENPQIVDVVFKRFDSDGDGKLNTSEFEKLRILLQRKT